MIANPIHVKQHLPVKPVSVSGRFLVAFRSVPCRFDVAFNRPFHPHPNV